MTDPAFAQDAAYEINAAASALQRTASQWRDAERKGSPFDPQHVAIAARETARKLHAIANEIERRQS